MSADDDRIDPRFDPAFQRGYSGPLATSPAQSAPAPLIAAPPRNAAPRTPPSQHRIVDAEPAPRGVLNESVPEQYDEEPQRRINPFLIALGVVAVVLLGGGLYLVSLMRELFGGATGVQTELDYVTLQVLMGLTPLVLILGLATGIGVLFLFALRWGQSRSSGRQP